MGRARRGYGLAALAMLAMLALVAATPSPARGAFPGRPGKLVFSAAIPRCIPADGGGQCIPSVNEEIFVTPARAKHGSPKRLTFDAGRDFNPAFSPNGRLIVFASTREGGYGPDLFVMRPDGSGIRQITDDPPSQEVWDADPAFGANGRWIVFERGFRRSKLWTIRLDGTGLRQLTHGRGWDTSPTVSRRGLIAFSSNRDPDGVGRPPRADLFLIRPDGTGRRKIADFYAGHVETPNFSPGGRRVAFVRRFNVYTTDLRGDRIRRLTARRSRFGALNEPAFSPDGRWIAALQRNDFISVLEAASGDLAGFGPRRAGDERLEGIDWQPLPRR